MERVYYIDHVSNDDINALSLKLNSMQEVSHIKINNFFIFIKCPLCLFIIYYIIFKGSLS